MHLFDVNVLLYAYRADSTYHAQVRPWFEEQVRSSRPFGLADLSASGFLRIVTHPKVFSSPEPMEQALAFVEYLRNQPNCAWITPGPRHWEIFSRLCAEHDVRGKLVPDAWFAALAMESGCTWVSSDRDFARFEGLDWKRPPGF